MSDAKFGKDNSGMVLEDIDLIMNLGQLTCMPGDARDIQRAVGLWKWKHKEEMIKLINLHDTRQEAIVKIKKFLCSKFSQQPQKEDNNEFGHSGDKTVSSYPEDNQQPPKERKVSLEEMKRVSIEAMRKEGNKVICPSLKQLDITCCAILSLLNATEERKGDKV